MPSSALSETCNGGADNATFDVIQSPASLQPGVPAQIRFRVNNTGSLTWFGEGNSPFPYRLGTNGNDPSPNQVLWGGLTCGGYSNSLVDQRAFLCNSVPPGGSTEFAFSVTAPAGSSGSVEFSPHMVYDAGTACDGWFGSIVHLPIPVASGPTCPNDALPVKSSSWRLEVWTNFDLIGSTVEQRYVTPNVGEGFSLDFTGGASRCAGLTNYSTRLTRDVLITTGGTYVFTLFGDDGVRLRVDGTLLINEWRAPQVATFTAQQFLSNGPHRIEVEQFQAAGGAGVALSWALQGTPEPPSPPTGLGASVSGGQVTLQWTGSSGATSYYVWRSTTSGGGYARVAPSPTTSYVDNPGDGVFYYVVSAINGNGESGFSNEASATVNTGGPVAPGKPLNLRAVVAHHLVTLAWDPPADASGTLTYHIKRWTDTDPAPQEIATTQDLQFPDGQVIDGTTYHYVVAAQNGAGIGPDSDPVTATPQESPPANPTLTLELRGPDSTLLPPGSPLTLNGDGWPSPNPLDVRMILSCPAGRTTNCFGLVQAGFDSGDGRLRINGAAQAGSCQPLTAVGPSNHSMRFVCPDLFGSVVLNPGETRTITIGLVVQPSEQTVLNVNASWGDLSASQSVAVPTAQIHPLIVIPGILGTMPPAYIRGEFDPMLGVYTPLMNQLANIGYEEEATVFRMPYDWRSSNRVSAGYLRDRIRQALTANRVPYVATDKVDLLVHSMGGLVTRAYVEGEGLEVSGQKIPYGGDIRKIIFSASPHRGFMEDYKTYEGGWWSDYLYNTPPLNLGMSGLLWPAFIKKRWEAAHPNEMPPASCSDDPMSGTVCLYDYYAMVHDALGGIDSLREMLPTPDTDALVQPFFGPYLCDSYPPCSGPYPFGVPGRPVNPLLPGLNLSVGLLDALIGPENIYVIYGTDPSPAGSISDDTDVVYDVKAPRVPRVPSLVGWANGEPEAIFTTPAGDDLIPAFSMNLKLLLPSIPDSNVAGFRIQNGVSQYGLPGPAYRHKQIMCSREMQAVYVPKWLAGLGPIPFVQPYIQPDVVGALTRGLGYLLAGECPVNLLFTDPQGRRLGYDPDSGLTYNEIPDSIYAAPNTEGQFLLMANLAAGTYHLKVSAFGDGQFALGLYQFSPAGTPRRWRAEGAVRTGEVREYFIVIDPTLPIAEHPPVADAGPDQTVPAGPSCTADVRLDGSGSSDPDGEALSFDWTGPFGYVTGVQPTVTLPVGRHEITLLVQDGQFMGRQAKTHVTVQDSQPPVVKTLKVDPTVLEPADGTMRAVTVTADVSSVCGGKGQCKIVEIKSDEGDHHDWQITGALTAKLRAERSAEGNGRTYELKVECGVDGAPALRKTLKVIVPPPGRMTGSGTIEKGGRVYRYSLDVWESADSKDGGRLSLDVRATESDDRDDEDRGGGKSRFRSTRVSQVRFSDRRDVDPGNHLEVDRVKFAGEGQWNGKAGYTFEAEATDEGEPGAHHDRFKVVIRDARGKGVAHVDGKIDSGNNESKRAPR